jgi:hypothetical protein
MSMNDDDLADLPPQEAANAVDPKGPERGKLAFRGTFGEVGEAIGIAATSLRPAYVAMGPAGGYSVFQMQELPWGDVEGDSAEAWPLRAVVVFLPPDYAAEPGDEAWKAHKIGPGCHRTASD